MRNKIILFISVILFVVGVFLVFLTQYKSDGSITVINHKESKKQLSGFKEGLLIKGETVSGLFTSKGSNLGGISFRFDNLKKISTDSVLFRLIDIQTNNLIYQGEYRVDQFQPKELFPFGFPPIIDSKGKTYQFQIESVRGNSEDAIALSKITPIYTIKYQYLKSELKSPLRLFGFIKLKLISLITDRLFLNRLFLYLSPFIIFSLVIANKNSKKRKQVAIFIPIVLIIISVISPEKQLYLAFLIIFIDFLFISIFFHYDERIFAIFAILMLVFSTFLIALEFDDSFKKAIMWVYIFLMFSLIQLLLGLIIYKEKTDLNKINS